MGPPLPSPPPPSPPSTTTSPPPSPSPPSRPPSPPNPKTTSPSSSSPSTAPGEKRASAMLISILHWLVQLCQYNDALLARPFMDGNGMFLYVRDCYGFYMEGDDDSVAALDEELLGKLEAQRDGIREDCRAIEGEIRAMEERLEGFKSRPSRVVELEKEEKVVEEEIKKLKEIVEQFTKDVVGMEKWVQDKEKADPYSIVSKYPSSHKADPCWIQYLDY